MSTVLTHVVSSILPPARSMAASARERGGELAGWLAGARHAPRPSVERRVVLVVAADHGVVDPGIALGAGHPTVIALAALDGGDAALCRIARSSATSLLLVDAGVAEPTHLPRSVLGLSPGHGSADLATGAALTPIDVGLALDAGIALVTALAEDDLGVLALGAVGLGGDVAAAAVIAALTGGDAELAAEDLRAEVAAGLAQLGPGATPLEVLAAVGGRDIAVLAGVVLAAAAIHVPVIVDGAVTTAAALVAARLAPDAVGYVCAAHGGGGASAAAARRALELTPLVTVGLGHGEGAGAAMALPLVIAAAAALAA
jgi:nicotinate-nucleotide--dimethylbenzimidazole phosphoribosyltransferase